MDRFLGFTAARRGTESAHVNEVEAKRPACYGNVNPSLRLRGHFGNRPSDDDLRSAGVVLSNDRSYQDPNGGELPWVSGYSREYGALIYKLNYYLDYYFGWLW